MLQYELEYSEKGKWVFIYYPEGKMDAPGRVAFYDDGRREVLQESEEDIKRIYAHHALLGINRRNKSGTVAWY